MRAATGRNSAAASVRKRTLGRCVDIAGALLEPGDLGPRAREVEVRSEVVRRDADSLCLVERSVRARIATPCPHEREHDERLVVRPG